MICLNFCKLKYIDKRYFYVTRPWPAGGIDRSVCLYVYLSIDQVKIFVQGTCRISRPISGSKLIFHMRMFLYERSRWPHV